MWSRREFGKAVLAAPAVALAAKPRWVIDGVTIGGQSYSFRHLPFDQMLESMRKIGVTCLELCKTDIEPPRQKGEAAPAYRSRLREWRLSVSMDEFQKVRRKVADAGMSLYVYMYDMRADFTDEEIARGFEMARALGVKRLNSSSDLPTVKRIDTFASNARIHVGLHNHSWADRPGEISTPAHFEEAMRGCSPYIGCNLDVGHLFASGYDPVAFIEKHHDRITTLHLKDRKKNDGPDLPFGQGETPLREILLLMKRNHYRFPGMIEYEIQGPGTFDEVKRCFEYCERALQGHGE